MAKDRENHERAIRFLGFGVCVVSLAFVIWSFYPGLMTADSIANLAQGHTDSYSDINAPLMSWFWGRLDTVVPGPALIFVIHLSIFWAACALFWFSTNVRSFRLGLALVLFGFMPEILAQTVVVWKDVALGVSLFMAVALVYFARTRGNKVALLISPLFLFYGFAARLNAFPAVLPIAAWTGLVAFEVFEIERKRATALLAGVGYFVVLCLLVYFVNYRLTEGRTDHPFQQVYLYDLAAMSVERNEPMLPDYVLNDPSFSFEILRSRYNERSVGDLIFRNVPNAGDVPPLRLTSSADEVDRLRDTWLNAIKKDPFAYLRHRTRVFAQLIGVSRAITAPYIAEGFGGNPGEFRGRENFGYAALMKYFGLFGRPFPQTFFFRGVIWIVLCVALGFTAIRRRLAVEWDMVFVLSLSSLLFVFAYFPTAPSTEFRYLFWPAIASAITVIFGVYLLWNGKFGQASEV